MIIWINGAFGSGKTTAAYELHKRLPGSYIYDPENIGFFLRKNIPPECGRRDFQDISLWREFNYKILKTICAEYKGCINVPMTIVNKEYYNEIIQRLLDDGIAVKHYILYANKETLLKRLRIRSFRFIGTESFAVSSIDRCLKAFNDEIRDIRIVTDNMTVDQTVDFIADDCGLTLTPDKRSKFHKWIDRIKVQIAHIR